MKHTSIICRLGRKRRMRKLILRYSPIGFTTYIEPFVGSGDIYLFLDLDENVKAVINDLDPIIADSWKIIKSNPSIENVDKYEKMSKTQITDFAFQSHSNPLDKLVANITRLSGSFSGVIKEKERLYKFPSIKRKLKKIDGISNYMKHTTVLRQDYKTVIRKYDNVNAFMYLDPPYESKKDMYEEDNMDYEEMSNILKSVKGKFLMSINDSANVRSIFKDFKKIKVVFEGGNNEKNIGKDRHELLIKNY
jgi:DNA adenine methylase